VNALIIIAALSGQCSDGSCAVTVEATVVRHHAVAAHHQEKCQRIAPVCRTVHFFRHHRPVRSWFRAHRPVRRLLFRRCH